MTDVAPRPAGTPLGDPRFRLVLWAVIGVVGWAGFAALAVAGLSTTPPTAAFDLELVLEAGRRVAAGASPYDPAALGAGSVEAQDLFYSYPPPVAQAASLLAGLSTAAVLGLLVLVAVGGIAAVAAALARHLAPERSSAEAALAVTALSPFVFPFAIALLFGNLDAAFPLLYGLLVLAAVAPQDRSAADRRWALAGGAVALAALKLHPASLGLWLIVRGLRERGPRIALATVVGVAAAIVGGSLLVGGPGPWRDYLELLGAASGADLIDRRNIGPGSQIALVLGLDESAARVVAVAASGTALLVTALAALRIRDPLASVAVAVTASLVTLPVTWFHYPAALLPVGVAAVIRSDVTGRPGSVRIAVGIAAVVASVAVLLPVGAWVAVTLVLATAGRRSAGRSR